MVVEQVVVSAILAVSSAQNVRSRRPRWSLRRLRLRCLLTICSGSRRRGLCGDSGRNASYDGENANHAPERNSFQHAQPHGRIRGSTGKVTQPHRLSSRNSQTCKYT